MKRILVLLALAFCLSLAWPAFAQTALSTTVCPGTGCVVLDVRGQGTLGVQVQGTFVGTLTVKASIDQANPIVVNVYPIGSTTPQTTITGAQTGIYSANVAGLTQVQILFTAYTSGTALVSTSASTAGFTTTR